jgi:hypothetical protein
MEFEASSVLAEYLRAHGYEAVQTDVRWRARKPRLCEAAHLGTWDLHIDLLGQKRGRLYFFEIQMGRRILIHELEDKIAQVASIKNPNDLISVGIGHYQVRDPKDRAAWQNWATALGVGLFSIDISERSVEELASPEPAPILDRLTRKAAAGLSAATMGLSDGARRAIIAPRQVRLERIPKEAEKNPEKIRKLIDETLADLDRQFDLTVMSVIGWDVVLTAILLLVLAASYLLNLLAVLNALIVAIGFGALNAAQLLKSIYGGLKKRDNLRAGFRNWKGKICSKMRSCEMKESPNDIAECLRSLHDTEIIAYYEHLATLLKPEK